MLFWQLGKFSQLEFVCKNNSGFSSIKNSKKCILKSQNNSGFSSNKNSKKVRIKKSELFWL